MNQIKVNKNLVKVTFSYYDFLKTNNLNQPNYDDERFINPDSLNSHSIKKLEKLNWKIAHGTIANTGYKIIVCKKNCVIMSCHNLIF